MSGPVLNSLDAIGPVPSSDSFGAAVFVALIAGSLCAAAGTVLLKLGASGSVAVLDFVNTRILGGLTLYGLGSASWIYAMSRAPLSVVYPFTALTFVLVMLSGILLLNEEATPAMLGGSALILAGIGWIAVGAMA